MNYKNLYWKLPVIFGFIILSMNGMAQEPEHKIHKHQIYISREEVISYSFDELVEYIKSQYNIRVFYKQEDIPDSLQFSMEADSLTITDLFKTNLQHYDIFVTQNKEGDLFLYSGPPLNLHLKKGFLEQEPPLPKMRSENNKEDHYLKTRKEFFNETIVIGTENGEHAGHRPTLSGYISGQNKGEPVIGATIYIQELEMGTVSDHNGYYTLTIPAGQYTLIASSLGRKERKMMVSLHSDGRLNIKLEDKLFSMEEVVVSTDEYHNVRSTSMGLEQISIKEIKEIPQVLGEKDVLKVALMLPGVQNTGEGSSGFNVRGSPADQTLFYINHVPVYNASHLLGFFSSFHPDAIRDFKLYKSNIPVQYGGRLSSVFDISTIHGNRNKFSARGGISPVTGRLLFETPVKKETSSLFMGVRSTYSDWLLKRIKNPDIRESEAYFGDAIGQFSSKIGDNHHLEVFGYYSQDNISFSTLSDYGYQNQGSSISWDNYLGNKTKLSFTGVYSKYGFVEKNYELDIESYQHSFYIQDYAFSGNISFQPVNAHHILGGYRFTMHHILKGKHSPLKNSSLLIANHLGHEKGMESSVYIADTWKATPNLNLYAGLRYNNFTVLGPQEIYQYQPDAPKREGFITDTLSFANNEPVKSYHFPGIRLAANWIINTRLSLKTSYNRLQQNIFMMYNTVSISPTSKWKLADYHIKPMTGNQFALGVYTNPSLLDIEISIESYIKNVKNLVEFRNGAELLVNELPETDIIQGKLNAYGVEFMVRKKHGKLNGWFNYTYSKAMIKMNSPFEENRINFGNPYPANYDKPHSLNLVANYRINRRFSLSANSVYSTGRPTTFPVGTYYHADDKILNYSQRNEYRLPDYFRVDLSLNIEGNLKADKLAHGSWMFSVYNLLGRKNAYSVFFQNDNGGIHGYKLSIFGAPIPTITYNLKLGNYAD